MRKILAVVLACAMLASMAACGGKPATDTKSSSAASSAASSTAPSTADEAPEEESEAPAEAPATDGKMSEEEYSAGMSEAITTVNDLFVSIGELTAAYDGSQEWVDTYNLSYNSLQAIATLLGEMSPTVPDTYIESHTNITASVIAFADSMAQIGAAIDLSAAGDAEGAQARLEEGVTSIAAAKILWDEAVVTE